MFVSLVKINKSCKADVIMMLNMNIVFDFIVLVIAYTF
jgi:hypothetical protein